MLYTRSYLGGIEKHILNCLGFFGFGLFYFILFIYFFSELRTEPRALCLLGKCSATELNHQPQQPVLLTTELSLQPQRSLF